MFEHILRDLFIVAGQILETRHIIGVGNEAYIEYPVGLDRDAVLVAERHEIENKRILRLSFGEQLVQFRIELGNLER